MRVVFILQLNLISMYCSSNICENAVKMTRDSYPSSLPSSFAEILSKKTSLKHKKFIYIFFFFFISCFRFLHLSLFIFMQFFFHLNIFFPLMSYYALNSLHFSILTMHIPMIFVLFLLPSNVCLEQSGRLA